MKRKRCVSQGKTKKTYEFLKDSGAKENRAHNECRRSQVVEGILKAEDIVKLRKA